jgi:tetratricopeptide (TPR) repeat protein
MRKFHSQFMTLCLLSLFSLSAFLAFNLRDKHETWTNVPTPPGYFGVRLPFIGDIQAAYFSWSLVLQNLGDMDGEARALDEYNYKNLHQWFIQLDSLDPKGRVVPYLAAYYFSATQNTKDLRYVITYLEHAGMRPGEQNWRWLVQAIYLARFKMNDLDLALSLSDRLANLPTKGRPNWTYQMPAFIYNAKGQKEEARTILVELLKSAARDMAPEEILSTRMYICDRILSPDNKAADPLCDGL